MRPLEFDEPREVAKGVRVRLRRAGHILGSASVELEVAGGPRIVVSGDLGRGSHPLLSPPDAPPDADVLLVESTYGDRSHGDTDAIARLALAIGRTAARGGVTVIPAFAVDRTEVVLVALRRLMDAHRIPRLPIYVDSPMALDALEVYRRALAERSPELRPELCDGDDPCDGGTLVEARSVAESREINKVDEPAIIVSASGMATGGRILHHLARRLPDARNSVVLVGYQAAATRGQRLLAGERSVKMFGRYVPVRAEVVDITTLSVHADREELLAWMARAPRAPGVSYVVHGEAAASESLRAAIEEELGWLAVVPRLGERVVAGTG